MERLSEGAIDLNDNEVFNNCSYSCYANIADSLNKLAEYEDIGIEPERLKEFLGNFGISIVMKNTKLMNELQENKEIISKMAKRLKAFEENTFNMNWIPASERLPEEYGCYMVAWRPIHSNTENNLQIAGVPHFYEILEFDPNDESLWISSIRQCKEYEILAWQPLPEPYKEELL